MRSTLVSCVIILIAALLLPEGAECAKTVYVGGTMSLTGPYGPGKIEGIDAVRVDQLQKGKIVKLGVWPCRHIYGR